MFTRRKFLGGIAATPFLPGLLRADDKKVAANDRLTLGFIGVGTMGRGHLGGFLGMNDVQVVAVSDVVKERMEDAQKRVVEKYGKDKKTEFKGCEAYKDFRDLLARKDIDAVVIATPDHWHAIGCVLAARAGKHIYCEKPLTQNIAEGRWLVDEVKKAGITFQVGSQQRSEFNNHFRKAVELVRNGRIGKVKQIRIGVGSPNKPCDLPTQDIPEGTDWDMWQGPAPERGYNEILCPKGIHKGFPQWRAYREYAGGGVADMGAHHFDIAQWALDMDKSGPVEILPPKEGEKGLRLIYANGIEMVHGGEADCVFEGERGTILASRGFIKADKEEILTAPLGEKDWKCYPSTNHKRNWVECVKAKKETICPAETGHRTATVCHLVNLGYQLRRNLKWDPVKEQFVGDADANKLTSREPRAKWKV